MFRLRRCLVNVLLLGVGLLIVSGNVLAAPESITVISSEKKGDSLEQFAITELKDAAKGFGYSYEVLTEMPGRKVERTLIIIGRAETNAVIRGLIKSGFIKPETRAEGYALKIGPTPYAKGKTVVIAGADSAGTLYGTMDFIHYYLAKLKDNSLEDTDIHESPRLELRGIWSWGGKIYNYKMFFDQMARWKMNIAVLWHEELPKNAKEVQDYAHSRGIKLIWGYSWGWPGQPKRGFTKGIHDRWKKKILNECQRYYDTLGELDGIYFQVNTERPTAEKREKYKDDPYGDVFMDWVAPIAGELLRRHPDLWISCGIHWEGVKGNYELIGKADPRCNLMWENFPGSRGEEKSAIPKKLVSLRGAKEDVGFVLKGFYGQVGGGDPMLVKKEVIEALANQRQRAWVGKERAWKRNLHYAQDVIKTMAESPAKRKVVVCLLESSLWEGRPWLAVGYIAEALWNPYRSSEDIVNMVRSSGFAYDISPAPEIKLPLPVMRSESGQEETFDPQTGYFKGLFYVTKKEKEPILTIFPATRMVVGPAAEDLEINLEMRLPEGGMGGILFRYKNIQNFDLVNIDTDRDKVCWERREAGRRRPGARKRIGRDIANNQWIPVSVKVQGERVKVTIDGKEVIDTSRKLPLPGGHYGFFVGSNPADYRNIQVKIREGEKTAVWHFRTSPTRLSAFKR